MRKFLKDDRGNVGLLLGLSLLPICCFIGAAVDFGRAIHLREFVRDIGDSAALAVAGADIPDDGSSSLESIRQRITSQYGANAQNVSVTGSWVDGGTYKINIDAKLKAYILPAVPGMGQTLPVGVEIRVNRVPPKYETEPPTLSQLSPEAADYNRIYMYCYNADRKNESDKGRRGMIAIADNGDPGLDYSKNKLPVCQTGELVSYKLRNVRNVRSDKSKWDANNQEVYEYYTDTALDRGTKVVKNNLNGGRINGSGTVVETVDVNRYPLLETIVCDTKAQCKPKDSGGILPNNHVSGRTPATATVGCTEGKYMYWGWEDRPGGDQDYDDIRLVTSCPKEIKIADKQVHLTQ